MLPFYPASSMLLVMMQMRKNDVLYVSMEMSEQDVKARVKKLHHNK